MHAPAIRDAIYYHRRSRTLALVTSASPTYVTWRYQDESYLISQTQAEFADAFDTDHPWCTPSSPSTPRITSSRPR